MVKIGDLFDIMRGSCSCIEDYSQGDTPLVSASTMKNGVVGFIKRDANERFFTKTPCLSVPVIGEGGTCCAMVQEHEFHATINVEILTPKIDLPFWQSDKLVKLYAIASFIRINRWRFSYGRTAGGRLSGMEIDEQQIFMVSGKISISKSAPSSISITTIQDVLAKVQQLYGANASLLDVFTLDGGDDASVSELLESGPYPVATASEKEINSIGGYLAAVPAGKTLKPAHTITVAKDGKPGVARVQQTEYLVTCHSTVLRPNYSGWTDQELAVLAAYIESQAWRFSYGRSASDKRLAELRFA